MDRILHTFAIVLAALAAQGPGAAAARSHGITVTTRSSPYGSVLFDGRGRALYAFTRDSSRHSRCFGACVAAWPVAYTRGAPRAGRGARSSLLGTIRRGGRLQVTYAGRPLYYYSGDPTGQIRCQNVYEYGGLWLVVRGGGSLVR